MKIICALLSILLITLSCGGKITDVTINKADIDKNYKPYMLNYALAPNAGVIEHNCPNCIDNIENTVFIFMPYSFTINNNTGKKLRIATIGDNFSSDTYQPIIVQDKFYRYVGGNININSGDQLKVTSFIHLPIQKKLLDKDIYERYFPNATNRKLDSIVLTTINPNLQKAIDKLLFKKNISIYYHNSKDVQDYILAIFCLKNQETATFRMDSLARLTEPFIYSCD